MSASVFTGSGSGNKPTSVAVYTGSYTIPAGFYAHVSANVTPTGSFTIAGSTALSGYQNSTNQTALSGSILQGLNNAGAPNLIGLQTNTSTGSSAGNAFTAATSTFTDSANATGVFWVPSGTVLNVSSGRYTVSLYPN